MTEFNFLILTCYWFAFMHCHEIALNNHYVQCFFFYNSCMYVYVYVYIHMYMCNSFLILILRDTGVNLDLRFLVLSFKIFSFKFFFRISCPKNKNCLSVAWHFLVISCIMSINCIIVSLYHCIIVSLCHLANYL